MARPGVIAVIMSPTKQKAKNEDILLPELRTDKLAMIVTYVLRAE